MNAQHFDHIWKSKEFHENLYYSYPVFIRRITGFDATQPAAVIDVMQSDFVLDKEKLNQLEKTFKENMAARNEFGALICALVLQAQRYSAMKSFCFSGHEIVSRHCDNCRLYDGRIWSYAAAAFAGISNSLPDSEEKALFVERGGLYL